MANKNKYIVGICCLLCACTAVTKTTTKNDFFTKIESLSPVCQQATIIANIIDRAYANIETANSLTDTAMVHICVADAVHKAPDTQLATIITDKYTYSTLSGFYKTCNETVDSIGTHLSLLFEYSDKLERLNDYAINNIQNCYLGSTPVKK